jgi:hypothetical protein
MKIRIEWRWRWYFICWNGKILFVYMYNNWNVLFTVSDVVFVFSLIYIFNGYGCA